MIRCLRRPLGIGGWGQIVEKFGDPRLSTTPGLMADGGLLLPAQPSDPSGLKGKK